MEFVKLLAFIVGLFGWAYWWNRRKWLTDEFERNERHEVPPDHQLRWDIRHLREDISVLTISNTAIMFLLLFLVMFR
ncbi:MAG: hypothetical protein A3G24_15005 [Betaproteobacteria bacterium RIFCSPLOWO2_12_FULL_62_13]|nr:MAG: hypothetical protein A3G24_15005 [Betaproteobacteria bacterium RIFCSPLOWO2_12_FULL_62_13]